MKHLRKLVITFTLALSVIALSLWAQSYISPRVAGLEVGSHWIQSESCSGLLWTMGRIEGSKLERFRWIWAKSDLQLDGIDEQINLDRLGSRWIVRIGPFAGFYLRLSSISPGPLFSFRAMVPYWFISAVAIGTMTWTLKSWLKKFGVVGFQTIEIRKKFN